MLVFIGDGAAWVWEVARLNFPGAVCILDFYHALEHLHELCRALYPEAAIARRMQAKWYRQMEAGRISRVIASARRRLPQMDPSLQESLQKQIDSLQKALGDAAADADKLDKLSKDLEKLKRQAANMGSKDSQAGSAAREQLAKSLADLARQSREAGASPESLEEAIKALESNNTDLFLKDL